MNFIRSLTLLALACIMASSCQKDAIPNKSANSEATRKLEAESFIVPVLPGGSGDLKKEIPYLYYRCYLLDPNNQPIQLVDSVDQTCDETGFGKISKPVLAAGNYAIYLVGSKKPLQIQSPDLTNPVPYLTFNDSDILYSRKIIEGSSIATSDTLALRRVVSQLQIYLSKLSPRIYKLTLLYRRPSTFNFRDPASRGGFIRGGGADVLLTKELTESERGKPGVIIQVYSLSNDENFPYFNRPEEEKFEMITVSAYGTTADGVPIQRSVETSQYARDLYLYRGYVTRFTWQADIPESSYVRYRVTFPEWGEDNENNY